MGTVHAMIEATIEKYRDFFEYDVDLATGEQYLVVNGKLMTVEEFNRLQGDDD